MSTLEEIRHAIGNLDPRQKAMLTVELFAMSPEPDADALESALQRGLNDVHAGRVREIEDVKNMISGWTTKS